MRIFILIGGIGLAMSFSCFAAPKGPFFWKAEKDKKSSYILGIFRFGVSWSDLKCSRAIAGFLEESNVWLAESNPALDQQAHSALIAQEDQQAQNRNDIMADRSGQSFKSLSAASQKFLRDKLSQAQLSAGAEGGPVLEDMSYFGLSLILRHFCSLENSPAFEKFARRMGELEGKAIGFSRRVRQIAQSKNIALKPLDDLNDSIKALKLARPAYDYNVSAQDIENQIKAHSQNCSLKNTEQALDTAHKMFSLWIERYKAGLIPNVESDLKRLERAGFPDRIQQTLKSRFSPKILSERKAKWPQKIAQAHGMRGGAFVSAGIFPFPGQGGALERLKSKGFAIKRMGANCRF